MDKSQISQKHRPLVLPQQDTNINRFLNRVKMAEHLLVQEIKPLQIIHI